MLSWVLVLTSASLALSGVIQRDHGDGNDHGNEFLEEEGKDDYYHDDGDEDAEQGQEEENEESQEYYDEEEDDGNELEEREHKDDYADDEGESGEAEEMEEIREYGDVEEDDGNEFEEGEHKDDYANDDAEGGEAEEMDEIQEYEVNEEDDGNEYEEGEEKDDYDNDEREEEDEHEQDEEKDEIQGYEDDREYDNNEPNEEEDKDDYILSYDDGEDDDYYAYDENDGDKENMQETPYKCYHWSKKENERNLNGGWSIENEKRTCEGYEKFIFTQGDDSKAPGCGVCWCCQPRNIGPRTTEGPEMTAMQTDITTKISMTMKIPSEENEIAESSTKATIMNEPAQAVVTTGEPGDTKCSHASSGPCNNKSGGQISILNVFFMGDRSEENGKPKDNSPFSELIYWISKYLN